MNFRIFPKFYGYKRGQGRKAAVFFIVLFGTGLAISPQLRYYVWSLVDYPVHYKEYKEFGIRIPNGFDVHGIDVSKWQRRVDWDRVKKMKATDVSISFAFIKATEGSWLTDPQFYRNWEQTRKYGIIRGAYHFFWPNVSVKDQANVFTNAVTLKSGDLPPVVDVEETKGMTKAQIQRNTKAFLDLLEKHYKIKPILYTNRDFYKQYFADHDDFKPYKLWLAHYHVTSFTMPDDSKWHFWQHSDRGNINGINEKVDFNVFNGDINALKKICLP